MTALPTTGPAETTVTAAGAHVQPGILDEATTCHCVQQYEVTLGVDVARLRAAIGAIRGLAGSDRGPDHVVVAIGASLLGTLAPDEMPAGMRPFTEIHGTDGHVAPSTQDDLLLWFSSATADRCLSGAWLSRAELDGLADLRAETHGFQYFDHQDLTGFEDGTENPKGPDRLEVATIPEGPSAGGSFVLAQRWVHDLRAFELLQVDEQELVFGRTKDGSQELDPVPERSHVERVVTTDADGDEREIYRRSFPYGTTDELGLQFLAFNRDLSTFQDMLERMFGAADGLRDRLTDVSRPVSGAYYIAPTVAVLDAIAGPPPT
ncbi:Dyp-type peroxidase [Dermatobacter hominis]|uniref:Dyp-type peroxidase n=1 Tax=Dermatobacter hominis TaxID=2884263 RepID=UPI001D10F92D|nr:Dyp-type peroxidase [Dermatobacter hominis]UDY35400.1 Dyp-type peroxidase [Dermatobacter hominis]